MTWHSFKEPFLGNECTDSITNLIKVSTQNNL